MLIDEAIEYLTRIGLLTRFVYPHCVCGGLEITDVILGSVIGWDISEPSFNVELHEGQWLVVVEDKDTMFDRDIVRLFDSLDDAVIFIRDLYQKWGLLQSE